MLLYISFNFVDFVCINRIIYNYKQYIILFMQTKSTKLNDEIFLTDRKAKRIACLAKLHLIRRCVKVTQTWFLNAAAELRIWSRFCPMDMCVCGKWKTAKMHHRVYWLSARALGSFRDPAVSYPFRVSTSSHVVDPVRCYRSHENVIHDLESAAWLLIRCTWRSSW